MGVHFHIHGWISHPWCQMLLSASGSHWALRFAISHVLDHLSMKCRRFIKMARDLDNICSTCPEPAWPAKMCPSTSQHHFQQPLNSYKVTALGSNPGQTDSDLTYTERGGGRHRTLCHPVTTITVTSKATYATELALDFQRTNGWTMDPSLVSWNA